MRTLDAASVFIRAAVTIASVLWPASGPLATPPPDVAGGVLAGDVGCAVPVGVVAGAVVALGVTVPLVAAPVAPVAPVVPGVAPVAGTTEAGPLVAALAVAEAGPVAWLLGLAAEPHAVMTAADPHAAATAAITMAARAGRRAWRAKWFTKTPFRLPVGVWEAQERRTLRALAMQASIAVSYPFITKCYPLGHGRNGPAGG
jgi:hypothetical protein